MLQAFLGLLTAVAVATAAALVASERQCIVSIGMLEREDDGSAPESTVAIDAYVITERAERAGPCKDLTQRLR